MDITQTEIDDMRRLHEAATPGPWEAATLSPKGLIPAIIQRDQDDWLPVAYFADEHGDGEAVDMEENRALIVAARNALPRLLAALEEARAERDKANGLVKRMEHDNRVIARELDCSWGGSANPEHECKEDNPCLARRCQDAEERLEATATFLERATTRQCYLAKQAAEAERDALKAKLAGAEDERDAYGADIHSVLEKSVGLVAERDALRAERDKANLRERNIFASLRMALGEDLGGGGGLVEILNGIEGLQDQRDAAETQAWDALGRPDGTHDTSNVQRLCEAYGVLKATLAKHAESERAWCELATERGAKLAALVEAMEHIKDIMGGHDGCQGFSSPEDVWGIADKALAAAKVQP